ncbi:cytochrome P450 [Streptomyces sp. NPDC059679]|uniref:cytochrome P450 n=1 Tax=unclassified Streptomyces TaxID=2593676 RepID=UPI0015C69324|nr:cytochrome P450 [Streptomyces sp. NBS 14/10]KAK1182390.1 cytochrome P450 [Streptomyces sp. NBS 14/10]NUS90774.1 cytochrome P450 [Streptomyces sp.]
MSSAPAVPDAGRRPETREIPTIRRKDGIGGALAFRNDQLSFLGAGLARYGDIFRFRPLGIPIVLVNHPDYIRHILVEKGESYDKDAMLFRVVRPVLRKGLIANADMELWRRQRRMMAPHFTPRTVSHFARNMTDEADQMLQRWEPRTHEVLDVTDEIGQLALRIVNRSLFSADVGGTAQAFERAFQTANAILGDFFRFPFPPLNVPTPRNRRLHRAIGDMDTFVSEFIQEKLRADVPVGDEADLLTLLLHSVDEEDGKGMDLEQLHHEVLNICIGAYETTTNTLSWAFYLLARHPEVEEKLHAEVDAVLGERTVPSFEDLPRLTYTRMVCDETLRIYSPAYQFMRRAREEDVIDGYRVPANTNVLINSYFLHRHPDFWDDPERFVPERFTPEAIADRPKHVYTPFGAGHRICIGKHFALTELVLVLATVARRYRLVLPKATTEVHPEAMITLHPGGGIHLRLEERR